MSASVREGCVSAALQLSCDVSMQAAAAQACEGRPAGALLPSVGLSPMQVSPLVPRRLGGLDAELVPEKVLSETDPRPGDKHEEARLGCEAGQHVRSDPVTGQTRADPRTNLRPSPEDALDQLAQHISSSEDPQVGLALQECYLVLMSTGEHLYRFCFSSV